MNDHGCAPRVLLLIAGPPAAGKTTIARAISQALSWPLFEKDTVKELLFDTVGFSSRAEKVKLNKAALHQICYAAEAVLAAGQSVILESNFESDDRKRLEALIARCQSRVVTLRLSAGEDTLYQRFVKREQSPTRHLGHVRNDHYPQRNEEEKRRPTAFPEKASFLEGIKKRGMMDFALGECVCVDTTHPDTIEIDDIVQCIAYLRTTSVSNGET